MLQQRVLLAAGLCMAAGAIKFPSYITKCSRSDPHFSACVLASARAAKPSLMQGDRKLRLPPMDPLRLAELASSQSGGLGLNLTLRDVNMTGLAGANFTDDLRWDLAKQTFNYGLQVPLLHLNFVYEMSGKVLILPITGKGPGNVKLHNTLLAVAASYDLVTRDNGKQYLNFKPSTVTLKSQKVNFNFTNLFNGDPLLGPQTNLFLNDNWQAIMDDVAPSVAEGVAAGILSGLQALSDKISYTELTNP